MWEFRKESQVPVGFYISNYSLSTCPDKAPSPATKISGWFGCRASAMFVWVLRGRSFAAQEITWFWEMVKELVNSGYEAWHAWKWVFSLSSRQGSFCQAGRFPHAQRGGLLAGRWLGCLQGGRAAVCCALAPRQGESLFAPTNQLKKRHKHSNSNSIHAIEGELSQKWARFDLLLPLLSLFFWYPGASPRGLCICPGGFGCFGGAQWGENMFERKESLQPMTLSCC